ncbi:MAG: DUF11 domain-containing protein, partial [Caldilineaceae bacterium]|nr:DUF11 domain-containing protein [Caldilineaceae bacterium]
VNSKTLHLHFEENSGNTTFGDGALTRAAATCDTTTTCPTSGGTGYRGSALNFDGSDDWLALDGLTIDGSTVTTLTHQLDLYNASFTVLAWVKPASNSGDQAILGSAGSADNQALFIGLRNGIPIIDFGNNSFSAGSALSTGSWHHLAWRYSYDSTTDSGTMALYIDGVWAGSEGGHSPFVGEDALTIGRAQGSNYFAGDLDELTIYGKALTSNDLYHIAHPLTTTNVAELLVRLRHASEMDQTESEGEWLTATLGTEDAFFTTWSLDLDDALDAGSYNIDLKTTDSLGNSDYVKGVWNGEIDRTAPVIDFTFEVLTDGYARVQCSAVDLNLITSDWTCPNNDSTIGETTVDWFAETYGLIAISDTLRTDLNNITVSAVSTDGDRVTYVGTLQACDSYNQCATSVVTTTDYITETVAIITPTTGLAQIGLDTITLDGVARSPAELSMLTLIFTNTTFGSVESYTMTWSSPITETDWSYDWAPPIYGDYTLTARLTTGDGDELEDNAVHTVAIDAPELTIDKRATAPAELQVGDAITYTIVVTNSGTVDAAGVVVTDTLPVDVSGSDLSTTVDLAVGDVYSWTIPATLISTDVPTVTNRAYLSHTWQQRSASAAVDPCDVELVTNANDSGTGSLRQAVANACGNGLILFDGNYTIYLQSTIDLNKTLTIDGSGYGVTISGDSDEDGEPDIQLFTIASSGVVTLTELTLVDGIARYGGGLSNSGWANLTHLTMSGHQGETTYWTEIGGALSNSGTMFISNSIFHHNQSDHGGAIRNVAQMTIRDSLFYGNQSKRGGAIHSTDTLTVTGTTFQTNLVTGSRPYSNGGAIYSSGSLFVENSTFADNAANWGGGGIFNDKTATINQSTFVENTASSNGGGLYNYLYSTTDVTNSIFVDNSADDCFDFRSGSGVTTSNTLLSTYNTSWMSSTCSGATVTDELLLDMAALESWISVGPTIAVSTTDTISETIWLYLPLPGSPALDAGDTATCATTDQRGIARPQSDSCDIGAIESQGYVLTITGGNDQETLIGTAFADPLALTIVPVDASEPISGGQLTLTAPADDASLEPATEVIELESSGLVSYLATANEVDGSYVVTATTTGITTPVAYNLTNTVADLAITQSALTDTVGLNKVVTYTIAFSNSGSIT